VTKLLESLLQYLAVLYLNPKYRITDSKTVGSPTENASLRFTGAALSWRLTNDRGQIRLVVAPTIMENAENWFRLTSVRQYLDGIEERGTILTDELASWLSSNVDRVEQLFADESVAAKSCEALIAIEEAKATKLFGPDGAK
jgi:isocitrate dehydrogenase